MLRRALIVVIALALAAAATASAGAVPLPEEFRYDPAVPTPASVLGHPPGEWHVRHDRLVRYLEVLAEASDRLSLEVQGATHEGRPLVLLVATSPANHRRLEEVRAAHRALAGGADAAPGAAQLAGLPATVWLGYSVHGNEASGSNAAPLVAYILAAARGAEIDALLDETVVLIDPSLNPDGLARFAQWANMHRGRVPVADPAHREHREVWPGGRTNHYWFDLNRDWLLLVHPESQARLRTFHRWKPLLIGDYHEMGTSSTYFFQPGVPSRLNPLVPQDNLALTRRIAEHHRRALDGAGRLYFTEETFDDFYPGKGSTYPDLNGSVGVLFEQASARGHVQESPDGPRTLADAVHNQLLTSLSMLRAAREHRAELFEYRRRFFESSRAEASRDPVRGRVFAVPGDPERASRLLALLLAHEIRVHELARPVEAGGRRYEPGAAWVVPTEQPQYRLARALFERRTEFADSTFYDVSAWTMPLAFGAVDAELSGRAWDARLLGERVRSAESPAGQVAGAVDAPYAWIFEWTPYFAPRAVYRLLDAELRVRVALKPFEVARGEGTQRFEPGAIVVPVGIQDGPARARLDGLVREAAAADGVSPLAVQTGLTPVGIDLGSPNLRPLAKPVPLLVVGQGISGYEAGEVWHLLDLRFGIELSMVELERLGRTDLSRYTHLLLVDGDYGRLGDDDVASIRRWVRGGGVVVATKRGAEWAGSKLLGPDDAEPGDEDPEDPEADPPESAASPPAAADAEPKPEARRPGPAVYADFERERDARRITGAIVEAELDLTHPVAFGYREPRLALFRNSTLVLEPSPDPYENLVRYAGRPLLAGYVSAENLERIGGTPAVIATRRGRGAVIRMADNPNFRGIWYGTNRLYLNALFFGGVIKSTRMPPGSAPREDVAGR